jgi:hypothetical protein
MGPAKADDFAPHTILLVGELQATEGGGRKGF